MEGFDQPQNWEYTNDQFLFLLTGNVLLMEKQSDYLNNLGAKSER